jgi:hypothetical protein
MPSRIVFALIAGFFVLMNVLLWRWQFASRGPRGTPVPVRTVWEKVLTCPDNSSLEIRHRGVKIGRATCQASIGEAAATGRTLSEEPPPEGMVEQATGYTLDFDGEFSLDASSRLHFNVGLKLSTNLSWQELSLRFRVKPFTWELLADAAAQTVRYSAGEDSDREVRSFTLAELRQPERLLRSLGGPALSPALAALGLPLGATGTNLAAGLRWEAWNASIQVGRARVRAYRLEARLLDRYRLVLHISQVGEILRVELPDGIVLINEALTSM